MAETTCSGAADGSARDSAPSLSCPWRRTLGIAGECLRNADENGGLAWIWPIGAAGRVVHGSRCSPGICRGADTGDSFNWHPRKFGQPARQNYYCRFVNLPPWTDLGPWNRT